MRFYRKKDCEGCKALHYKLKTNKWQCIIGHPIKKVDCVQRPKEDCCKPETKKDVANIINMYSKDRIDNMNKRKKVLCIPNYKKCVRCMWFCYCEYRNKPEDQQLELFRNEEKDNVRTKSFKM